LIQSATRKSGINHGHILTLMQHVLEEKVYPSEMINLGMKENKGLPEPFRFQNLTNQAKNLRK
jgi:hypothetical protein